MEIFAMIFVFSCGKQGVQQFAKLGPMKIKAARETALLTLPCLIIGLVVAWVNLGGKTRLDTWWQKKNQSQIRIVDTKIHLVAPYDAEVLSRASGSRISLLTDESHPGWESDKEHSIRISKLNLSRGKFNDFQVPDDGEGSYGIGSGFAWDKRELGSFYPPDYKLPNATTFNIYAPLFNLSAPAGDVFVTGVFAGKRLKPTPFRVLLRPAWMTRKPKNLDLKSVRWRPFSGKSGGFVNVSLKYIGTKPIFLHSTQTGNGVALSPILPSKKMMGKKPVPAGILAHWSQRIESGDGQFNSLLEMKYKQVRVSNSLKRGQGWWPEKVARSVQPQVTLFKSSFKGNNVDLVYRVSSLPTKIKNPVFKAEIGAENDGFLPVVLPVK